MSWQDIQLHTFTAWINDYLKGSFSFFFILDHRHRVVFLEWRSSLGSTKVAHRW